MASQITKSTFSESADCKTDFHLLRHSDSSRLSLVMNDPLSHYTLIRTQMTALQVCWCGGIGKLTCAALYEDICTFWMLRSMLSGRLKRNLKRCRTLRAFRVESALSFRPRTSWKRVSAVSLAPTKSDRRRRKWEAGTLQKQMLIPHFPFNFGLWFSSCAVCYLTLQRPNYEG